MRVNAKAQRDHDTLNSTERAEKSLQHLTDIKATKRGSLVKLDLLRSRWERAQNTRLRLTANVRADDQSKAITFSDITSHFSETEGSKSRSVLRTACAEASEPQPSRSHISLPTW